jgi:septum formation protein
VSSSGAHLTLASASPRRHRLLEEAGIPFLARPADVEESAPARGDPHALAILNARMKAEAVPGELVLGADTVVALGGEILGKPRDRAEGRAMLAKLSGTTHSVVTGLFLRSGARHRERSVETRVTMRPLSAEEIDAYVSSGEGMGKAGGYAIQETADRFVSAIDGPYDNVVGLPVAAVREMLTELAPRA